MHLPCKCILERLSSRSSAAGCVQPGGWSAAALGSASPWDDDWGGPGCLDWQRWPDGDDDEGRHVFDIGCHRSTSACAAAHGADYTSFAMATFVATLCPLAAVMLHRCRDILVRWRAFGCASVVNYMYIYAVIICGRQRSPRKRCR